MRNEPTADELWKIPPLHSNKNALEKEIVIHMRFQLMGASWFIAEYDGGDTFFGYRLLDPNREFANSWGYFSLSELKEMSLIGNEVERDLNWENKPIKLIQEIFRGKGGIH